MTALITGASRGLGKAIATLFAKNKYDLILTYYENFDLVQKVRNELLSYNIDIKIIKCDISSEEDVKSLFSNINNIDVLINNASIAIDNDIKDKTALEFNKVINTNLTGTFLMCKYALEKMQKGSIVNISSTNGIDTYYPESIDYDCSKAGIISLTHNFSRYAPLGVRVNCVCPGWIETKSVSQMDPKFKKAEENKILLNRFAKVEEIADAVYFAAINTYLNNAILRVDGGVRND